MAEPIDPRHVFGIQIAGSWEAREFITVIQSIDFAYNAAIVARYLEDGQRGLFLPWTFSRYRRTLRDMYADWAVEHLSTIDLDSTIIRSSVAEQAQRLEFPKLKIKSIQYASPGQIDFLGAGQIVEQLRLFFDGIVDRFIQSEDRRLAREERKQEILSKKIANAERILKLAERGAVDRDVSKLLLREVMEVDDLIEQKVIEGKIVPSE